VLGREYICIERFAHDLGRESTTEQSLGGNAAELVGWAYRGTQETSNQWIGCT